MKTSQVIKSIQEVYVVLYNTRINDDAHSSEVIAIFSDKDSALEFTIEQNCNERAKGNYNWYVYFEVKVD